MLKATNIGHILSLWETKQKFLSIFGETEDDINELPNATEIRIEDLVIQASKEVPKQKSATKTALKKLSYPSFNGDVLNFLKLIKRWTAEVTPEWVIRQRWHETGHYLKVGDIVVESSKKIKKKWVLRSKN